MTVKELKQELYRFDDETEVVVINHNFTECKIKEVSGDNEDQVYLDID